MWIRVKVKSAWKLTQGLDWEQSLFCAKICELLRYIMRGSHEQRGCADATTTRCLRLRRVHLVLTIYHSCSQIFEQKRLLSFRGLRSFRPSALTLYLWIGLCPWVLFLLFNVTVNRARFYMDEQLICMQLNAFVFPLIVFIISTCGN